MRMRCASNFTLDPLVCGMTPLFVWSWMLAFDLNGRVNFSFSRLYGKFFVFSH